MTCPIAFRRHVLAVKTREDLSFDQTAKRFSVGIASVVRWNTCLAPKPHERRKVRKIDPEKLMRGTCATTRMPGSMSGRRGAGFRGRQSGGGSG